MRQHVRVMRPKRFHKLGSGSNGDFRMNIPLFIRLLEYAKEDAKTDMDLHSLAEKIRYVHPNHLLTMEDYAFLVSPHNRVGGAVGHDLKWYEQRLKNIKERQRDHWTDDYEEILQDFEDVLSMMKDDQVSFDDQYLSSLKLLGQSVLNDFPSGREEMKY